MNKKPVLIFTIADQNNMKYAKALENSLRKFHKDIPFYVVTGTELEGYLKDDPNFFYRATPILAEKFMEEYELVIKIDADSIICGDISYIWKTTDYDTGTVINWNRYDQNIYGLVQGWGIQPIEYMNCGLVAMRNKKFVHDWKILCFTNQFERLQYREQDLLNAMIYFGNWNIRCFDHGDGPAQMSAWWGLISKGEWNRTEIKGDTIFVPKGFGPTPFPPKDMEIKVIHWGGGNGVKMNYKSFFPEVVSKRLDYLVSEEDKA